MATNPFALFELPCTDPERMDDWFIDERPKLEVDELRDIREAVNAAAEAVNAAAEEAIGDHVSWGALEIEAEVDRRVAARIKDLKTRRRHAIQSCYLDCPAKARLMCLDKGLQPGNQEYGIYGAYPESERRSIVQSLADRDRPMSTRKAVEVIISAERREALNPNAE